LTNETRDNGAHTITKATSEDYLHSWEQPTWTRAECLGIRMWQAIFSACLATKYLSIFVCPVTAVSFMLPNNYTHIL